LSCGFGPEKLLPDVLRTAGQRALNRVTPSTAGRAGLPARSRPLLLWASPQAPLWAQVRGWLLETLEKAGVTSRMGPSLFTTFPAAGLPEPRPLVETFAQGGPDAPAWGWANVVSGVVPLMEGLRVTTAAEVDPATTLGAEFHDGLFGGDEQWLAELDDLPDGIIAIIGLGEQRASAFDGIDDQKNKNLAHELRYPGRSPGSSHNRSNSVPTQSASDLAAFATLSRQLPSADSSVSSLTYLTISIGTPA
jgi:hypothetical protein